MIVRRLVPVGAVFAAAALVLSGASAVQSAPSGAPMITLTPSFPVGEHIRYRGAACDGSLGANDIPVRIAWSNPARSEFALFRIYAGAAAEQFLSTTSWSGTTLAMQDDYDGSCGEGGGAAAGGGVLAFNSDGSEYTAFRTAMSAMVLQEDGQSQDWYTGVKPRYKGAWSVSRGPWASGGTARYSTAKKASVTLKLTVPGPSVFGLVMAKGPKRGSAKIKLDGSQVATVNTHAGANDNQVIVWSRAVAAGTHKVKVVNVGTKGHSRIDVDGFLTMLSGAFPAADLPPPAD